MALLAGRGWARAQKLGWDGQAKSRGTWGWPRFKKHWSRLESRSPRDPRYIRVCVQEFHHQYASSPERRRRRTGYHRRALGGGIDLTDRTGGWRHRLDGDGPDARHPPDGGAGTILPALCPVHETDPRQRAAANHKRSC